jgi:hypothetical protein
MAGAGINISAATRQTISRRQVFSRLFERMVNSFLLKVENPSVANPGALVPSPGARIGTATVIGFDYAAPDSTVK